MSYVVEELASGSGFKVQGTVSMAVSKYDLLMLIGTGHWHLASVTDEYLPAVGMAVENIGANRRGTILLQGLVHNNAWSWTPGVTLYASTVDGEMVQSPPLGMANVIQEVGMAVSPTLIHFDPKRAGNIVSFVTTSTATKIYDITHSDTDAHSVDLPVGYPENTVALIVSVIRAGTGNLHLRPAALGTNMILGQNGWGMWLRSPADGKFHYALGTADDDWDVYSVGYITG